MISTCHPCRQFTDTRGTLGQHFFKAQEHQRSTAEPGDQRIERICHAMLFEITQHQEGAQVALGFLSVTLRLTAVHADAH